MSENELLSLLGFPKTTFNIDNSSNVVTYVDSKFDLLYFCGECVNICIFCIALSKH